MGKKAGIRRETPIEAFEKLRQGLDSIKEKHYDAWCWHPYLGEEPQEVEHDPDDDPEMLALKPRPRRNVDRLKQHLVTTIQEMNRVSAAADMAYFHMCTTPETMKECCTILGTSGDIDEDLLKESGDASPAKILAALQKKLDVANDRIAELEWELEQLRERFTFARMESDDRWIQWQNSRMEAEDAITRLDTTTNALDQKTFDYDALEADFNDLYNRHIRASRLMVYKARQQLRDRVFANHPREILFYTFHGFCHVLTAEKEERIRAEHEEERNAIEFALRNEVKFLLSEKDNFATSMRRVAIKTCRLTTDRRQLAKRILHKHRPKEPLEYLLWMWEWWQQLRARLVLEKRYENEQTIRAGLVQQLNHTSAQIIPMALTVDELKQEMAEKSTHQILEKRQMACDFANQLNKFVDHMQYHRKMETATINRIHVLDTEIKDERIAILEREIAEDKHIQALRGMVVDLESRLRKALDRRKQKPFVVQPGGGIKCEQCQRENILRGWKMQKKDMDIGVNIEGLSMSMSDLSMPKSASETDLRKAKAGYIEASPKSQRGLLALQEAKQEAGAAKPFPFSEKKATYAAVWRGG